MNEVCQKAKISMTNVYKNNNYMLSIMERNNPSVRYVLSVCVIKAFS